MVDLDYENMLSACGRQEVGPEQRARVRVDAGQDRQFLRWHRRLPDVQRAWRAGPDLLSYCLPRYEGGAERGMPCYERVERVGQRRIVSHAGDSEGAPDSPCRVRGCMLIEVPDPLLGVGERERSCPVIAGIVLLEMRRWRGAVARCGRDRVVNAAIDQREEFANRPKLQQVGELKVHPPLRFQIPAESQGLQRVEVARDIAGGECRWRGRLAGQAVQVLGDPLADAVGVRWLLGNPRVQDEASGELAGAPARLAGTSAQLAACGGGYCAWGGEHHHPRRNPVRFRDRVDDRRPDPRWVDGTAAAFAHDRQPLFGPIATECDNAPGNDVAVGLGDGRLDILRVVVGAMEDDDILEPARDEQLSGAEESKISGSQEPVGARTLQLSSERDRGLSR